VLAGGARQVVGAVGFIVASGMLTLETQRNWWRPEPLDIGWHVAFWNLVVRARRRAGARAAGGTPPLMALGARMPRRACVSSIGRSAARAQRNVVTIPTP